MNSKTKFWLLQIFATKIGWLGIDFLLMIIFAILSKYYMWAGDAVLITTIYPIVLTLIGIAYAFVINPMREYKERKKKLKK